MNQISDKKTKTKWRPKISVVIPAYNEEKNIAKCIQSLLDSNYPKNKLEIIVVDDGSKDNTYAIAKKYKKYGVRVFRKKNEGTAAITKNYGIKKATGELIATLDADSYILKDTIIKLLPLFDSKKVVAVTPAIKVSEPENFLENLQKVEYVLTLFSRKLLNFLDAVFVTPGPFSLFRADLFKKIGYFDEKNILEDQELALRIQKHNLKINSSMEAEVFTNVPENFVSLVKQRIRWHRGGLINTINHIYIINPKYGDFGLFIMPISLIAVVAIFAIILNVSYNIIFNSQFSESLFLDNLALVFQPVHFVGIVLFILTLVFTIHQLNFFKKDNINPVWAIIFIICYAYLITFYWILAIGKQIKGDRISW
jgi:cellulose synthase/poly-beta-1,6-N-acetylglucosamine synthase-like glycosyltransferase